ncbi:MAG: class I SAM-dependent methyltransferase [Acidimicrobiia bacterium]
MGINEHDEALIDLYARKDESTRLARREGRVELLRTRALLRQRLEPAQRILDVGGADGVHASWLIDDGHEVEIVDLVPLHVERARRKGLRARTGDGRQLPFDDASFDVVLLLGPLYHLTTAEDRARCLAEAQRVLRDDGLLAAAAVSRLSVALDHIRKGRFDDAGFRSAARRIVDSGRDDTGYGAGLFYFHTPSELHDELAAAAFGRVEVHGVEGPAWPLIDVDATADDPLVAQVLEIAEMADGEPAAVAASAHLLAFGRRGSARPPQPGVGDPPTS